MTHGRWTKQKADSSAGTGCVRDALELGRLGATRPRSADRVHRNYSDLKHSDREDTTPTGTNNIQKSLEHCIDRFIVMQLHRIAVSRLTPVNMGVVLPFGQSRIYQRCCLVPP